MEAELLANSLSSGEFPDGITKSASQAVRVHYCGLQP